MKRKKAKVAEKPQAQAGGETPKAAQYERERREIAISLLRVAPWNPRGKITPESVADLAGSIKTLGVIQPLVAMLDKDDNATLIAGHRRLAAARLAGLDTVPCDILMGVDEETAKRMTFIENLQRKDAEPLLEAELVGGLVKSGMTQGEIASETGRGLQWVARRLNLAKLSKSWRKRVADGEQITTDCLEHIAAYPEATQEVLKKARGWNNRDGALRWADISSQFDRETCNLKNAVFDKAACKGCPNNTGCSPDLFDWDGKPATFGECLHATCYKRKTEAAIKATVADAKKNGAAVKECKSRPDYSIGLQSKPDARHQTLYVWKNYNGETQVQWGETARPGTAAGGMTEEQKEARRKKIAANKARRKLAEWCEGNLAGVIAPHYTVDVQIARSFQTLFDIGSSWRVFGSQTNATDAALAHLLEPDTKDNAPGNWYRLAPGEIAAKIVKPEIGARYAELLLAILPEAADALTDEERRLVVTDEKLAKLREPVRVKWTDAASDAEAEDAALTEQDETETEGEE